MNRQLSVKAYIAGALVMFAIFSMVHAVLTDVNLLIASLITGLTIVAMSLYAPGEIQDWMDIGKRAATKVVDFFDTKVKTPTKETHDHLSNVL